MTYTTLSYHKNGYRILLTLLLTCLLAFGSNSAQAVLELEWAKSAGSSSGDSSHAVAVDDSGNTYVTGSYGGEEGNVGPSAIFGAGEAGETALSLGTDRFRMFVAKYTPSGNLIWAKRSGGSTFVTGNDIAVDSSGNTYVTGSFFQISGSTTIFGPGEANETTFTNDIEIPTFDEFDNAFNDMFVAKYAADGSLVWVKHAGGSNPDDRNPTGVSGFGIAVDVSGNTYVTGNFAESATFGPGEVGETTLTSDGAKDIL
ncbi:MAG: SBBP repeat-containing protein [Methylococcales bacterium]